MLENAFQCVPEDQLACLISVKLFLIGFFQHACKFVKLDIKECDFLEEKEKINITCDQILSQLNEIFNENKLTEYEAISCSLHCSAIILLSCVKDTEMADFFIECFKADVNSMQERFLNESQ